MSVGLLLPRLSDGKFLIGWGGANDIASAAAEVIVITRCDARRMVDRVSYTTSPGQRVTTVVTDYAAFGRAGPEQPWQLSDLYPAWGNQSLTEALGQLRAQCAWPYRDDHVKSYASPISTREMKSLHSIHPSGELWTREPPLDGAGA